MRDLFPRFCHSTRFNRTRRNLHAVIEEIFREFSRVTDYAHQPYRIVDSIPIPVCKFGRAKFHKTLRGFGANYGKFPFRKETCLGYKLHMLVILDSFATDFIITSTNIDDREGVWDLVDSYQQMVLIGDKVYIGNTFAADLKKEIDLLPVKKSNSKVQFPKAIRQLIFKLRRRIETSGSQLTQQLNIEKVMTKSYWGLPSRIKTKFLAYNLCYYINMLIGRDVNFSRTKEIVLG